MKPVRLTFTGIDAKTDLEAVMRIGLRHPEVEFAVLVGSKTGMDGSNRYPGLDVVRDFRCRANDANVRCAIHLCGRYSRAVMKQQYVRESFGFDRIQVNASRYDMPAVEEFKRRFVAIGVHVIVQWRTLNTDKRYPGIVFLYDESCGRGIDSIKTWPLRPLFGGFAGGLCAANIHEAVGYVRMIARPGSWLDMETGVRTDDWFDLAKVEEVIDLAKKEN